MNVLKVPLMLLLMLMLLCRPHPLSGQQHRQLQDGAAASQR
jgi:hypothetical protein